MAEEPIIWQGWGDGGISLRNYEIFVMSLGSDLWQQSTLRMTLTALKSVPEWGQVEIMFLLVSEQP